MRAYSPGKDNRSMTPDNTRFPEQLKGKVAFSGIQPSGIIHIGNYLGAVRNFVALQEYTRGYYCVVDLHAITEKHNPEELRNNILAIANIYLAAGLDPKRSTLFVQSQVHEHAELAWILNCHSYFGELRRMTQFKDKAGKNQESATVGLFDYPVLMAADILLYQADIVPVGEDQKQHVELTRNIAERFNHVYGDVFTVPEPYIPPVGARIRGLDDPTKKMSKSAQSPNNYISLTDPPDVIRRKISRAVTDSGSEIRHGPDKPAISNLLEIYSLMADVDIPTLEQRYEGKGYAQFKKDLAEVVVERLRPIQERYQQLSADPAYTIGILKEGAERAKPVARQTLTAVMEEVGLFGAHRA